MAIVDEELPEDVLIDILSRLPAKSLLRFKSVSKYWYSLILNPNFISLHHTRAQPFHCVYVVRVVENNAHLIWSLHLLPDQTSIHHLDLSFTALQYGDMQPTHNMNNVCRGCCNGLVCLWENSNIVICNPATREFRLLPQPPRPSWPTRYVGFAYDSKTDDYKVVRVADHREKKLTGQTMQVYSMSADLWKEVAAPVPSYSLTTYYHPCTLLDGIFYWLSYDAFTGIYAIDALNTLEGSFGRIPFPTSSRASNWQVSLCLLDNSVAIVSPNYDNQLGETRFDIWLMDKYRLEEIWTRKYTIGPLPGSHIPFGFRSNGKVLVSWCENGRILSTYNHSTGRIEEFDQLRDSPEQYVIRHVFSYSESLLSVKRDELI